jgi:ParB-like chromosome segregation protein Spo0J
MARTRDMFKTIPPADIASLQEFAQVGRWGELNQAHVDYLAVEIARDGQRAPVLVRTGPNGKPELVAGRHRKAAVLQINGDLETYGRTEPLPLFYVLQEMDDMAAAQAAFAENTGLPLTCMDLAKAVMSYSNMGWNDEKIAQTLNAPHHKVSKTRVSQLRSLIRLPHSIQESLHRGTMPESAARALIALQIDREEMETIAEKLRKGEMRAAELSSRAAQERRAKGKRVKRTINDLRVKLDDLSTQKSLDFLAWLDGEVNDDEVVDEIFAEEGE